MIPEQKPAQPIPALANFIFMARWLHVPPCLGLILARRIFARHDRIALVDRFSAQIGHTTARTIAWRGRNMAAGLHAAQEAR